MKKEFDKWYDNLSDKDKGRISFHHYNAGLSIIFVCTKENTRTELTTQLQKYLKPFDKRIIVGVMKQA